MSEPGNLYLPGVGTCTDCGETGPTYANGRMGSHTRDGRDYTDRTRAETCPATGRIAAP